MSNSFSLYLHSPYCSHRCPYCDFNVHVRKSIPEGDFISALISEARFRAMQSQWEGRNICSIFLGGGTPSLFKAASINRLINELKSIWHFDSDIEISLEANPDNLSEEKLVELNIAGVNRLSIGVQSFSNKFLKKLGRNHSSEEAQKAIKTARRAGFKNLNIDLMFSLPEQTLDDLKEDLKAAVALNTEHISYYSLTVESGTPFYAQTLSGSLTLPSNDLSALMMEEIIRELALYNFHQYEISNFSKAGFICRHNQNYWEGNDYLGIGPGAHSAVSEWNQQTRIATKRWSNRSAPESYLKNPTSSEAWSEDVLGSSLIFERLLLGLRQIKGTNVSDLKKCLDNKQNSAFFNLIEELIAEGLVTYQAKEEIIALTASGRMIADSVTEKFSEVLIAK